MGEGPGLRTLSGVLDTTREQETPLPPAGAPQQGLCHGVSPGPAHTSHAPHRWGEAERRHREQGCPRRTVHAEGGGLQREPGGGTGGEQGCGKGHVCSTHSHAGASDTVAVCVEDMGQALPRHRQPPWGSGWGGVGVTRGAHVGWPRSAQQV